MCGENSKNKEAPMRAPRPSRRITYDLFHVQGLYVGHGWVSLLSTFDRDEADTRLRQQRTKNPLVTYRIETQRVRSKAMQTVGLS
jgi:hypothetical protein